MRKKRRNRGTWFPNVGSNTGQPGQVFCGNILAGIVVPANTSGTFGGPQRTLIAEVVQDAPLDPEEAGNTSGQLSRIVGQEYILQRIVGSIFVGLNDLSQVEEPSPRAALITAGFFVARSEDADSVGGQDFPIGFNAASVAEQNENYSPQAVDTIREPWIWRRSWVLAVATQPGNGFTNFPGANSVYGSLREGTHIDAKSKRRIGNDDRLWLAIGVMSLSLNDVNDGSVDILTDHRIFGTVVRAHNKSTF